MKFNYLKKKIIIGTWSWSGMYKTISTNKIKKLIEKCLSNNFTEFGPGKVLCGLIKKVDREVNVQSAF